MVLYSLLRVLTGSAVSKALFYPDLSFFCINIIFGEERMSFINVRQLAKLVDSLKMQEGVEATANSFLKKYNVRASTEDLWNLVQTAIRINKREKSKAAKGKGIQKLQGYEIFCFGQLKIFNWVLILYSHLHQIDLKEFKQSDVDFIHIIFKKKTRLFVQYQIQDLLMTNSKANIQWTNEEVNLLLQIMKNKDSESEWKSISYELFCKSGAKFFKNFAMCREMWINHLNPNVKKTGWTAEEDVELFSLIATHGCRWALISRELKGIRSEHSVKNRYNALAKTIKKQYRLSDSKDLNLKVLKYLKMKLDKQSISQDILNSSVQSQESKCSRQRSREEEELKDSLNNLQLPESSESNKNCLFTEFYQEHPNPLNSTDNKEFCDWQKMILKDSYLELKEEKKTNDKEKDEPEECKLRQELLKFDRENSNPVSEVKTLTLEELEIEYNRLLNIKVEQQSPNLNFLVEFDDLCEVNCPPGSWLMDDMDNGCSWLDLQE